MKNLKLFIDSGILEFYVLGNTSPQENIEIQEMRDYYPEIDIEINAISEALQIYATANAVPPNPIIKTLLLATIDFTERLKNGEQPAFPPELKKGALISDYAEWINRTDMVSPVTLDGVYAKIIGYTPQALTAIVWIKDMAPQEVHDHEYEKFLILEGTCNITVGDDVYNLVPGDYFAVPLHKDHYVKVTSLIPCKAILQRIAA